MKRLLWGLAWIAVLVWSLFAWGAYGLLDFFGGVAARNADIVTGHPETVEWLSWAPSWAGRGVIRPRTTGAGPGWISGEQPLSRRARAPSVGSRSVRRKGR